MIQVRRRLLGSVRDFMAHELGGFFPWDRVEIDPEQEKSERYRGRPQYRENATVRFGKGKFGDGFTIEVSSPEEDGPLGWIKAYHDGDLLAEGPPDRKIWANIGAAIKERCHGKRTDE